MAKLDNVAEPHEVYPTILVLDFGSQYTHLIIHRLRELNVYSEILPCTTKLSDLRFKPVGLILSGGPYSVFDDGAPHLDPAFLHLGIPILGICYGLQELAYRLDHTNVVAGLHGEYTTSDLTAISTNAHVDRLFQGVEGPTKALMSHGDRLAKLPEGFHTIATSKSSEYAAIAHDTHPIYGIQFHPEVPHTPKGIQLLGNFAIDICGINAGRMMSNFVEQEKGRKRKVVKPNSRVLGGVSGGVDSAVAAKFVHEAIGHRFAAVLLDQSFLRREEREQVEKDLNEHRGIHLRGVGASKEFYAGLEGEIGSELERRFIGGTLIVAI
ncbi:hypothetical protein N8I77_004581 [Diaporthe amygdali]|uniref:GMPS ATP-PPase domain-containing protein n=1 Tax=Phomopsis amygdali TaxID=1214568 RepID=A0AAD9SNQ5_PHOAM|nr:hypothetical protein N8I77_004581 [Diaporthe amygdali]